MHDWLLGQRGGEKVLDALAQLCPDAHLFTLFADRSTFSPALRQLKLHTSWLDWLPGSHRYYRHLLPLMPGAIERFDLSGFDLVISSSHCVAKGVVPPSTVPHLCYCHAPMRYAWQLQDLYLHRISRPMRPLARHVLSRLRNWDRSTTDRVTQFIANGQTVGQRILEAYGRDSVVIHPPVDTQFFTPDPSRAREENYLVLSALVPNKRVDLAVQACQRLGCPLVVIGSGPEEWSLRRLGPAITFLGWQPGEVVRRHLQSCRALLFPGEEDFGIVPIEANACGTPVIAYGRGGATETIVPPGSDEPPTGLWFDDPTVEALAKAIRRFETAEERIDPQACRRRAERYRQEVCFSALRDLIARFM